MESRIRTPEMQEFIDMMNKSEFKTDLYKKIEENKDVVMGKYKELELQHESDSHVTLINGDRRRVKTNIAVAEMHDDIKSIKSATEWLFDFAKLHILARKYKLYWLVFILFSLFFSHNIWQPVLLELIKKL